MTRSIATAARASAGPDVEITATNPANSPPAIQGPEDGAAALPGLFALVEAAIGGVARPDAMVIACFDDTGVWDLKARSPVPVIGIGEAACQAAMLVAQRFSIVTTLPVSVPVIEDNLARYGFANRCARVRAANVPVLDLETNKTAAEAAVRAETERAVREDGCGAIVLGCAGMADLAAGMTADLGLPVIDGVAAAVRLAQVFAPSPKKAHATA